MRKYFPALLLVVLGWCAGQTCGQKVTTKVRVLDDMFLTESGLVPPPGNAVELEREFTITPPQPTSNMGLASDIEGNIYACLGSAGIVQKYNPKGEPLLIIGRKPNGKTYLREASGVRTANGRVAVHDIGRESLEIFDSSGTHVRSQKISECDDFALDGRGRLLVAEAVQDSSTPLVNVFAPDGKGIDFGKPLPFPHSLRVLNSRSLAISDKDEIFIAFTYFPIVRKYSADGGLEAEYRIESPVIKAKEDYNLRLIGEGIADPSKRVGYEAMTLKAKALGEKLYLLSVWPRLEITEIDDLGRRTATYWKDFAEVYSADDFAVLEVGNELEFCVAHASPFGSGIDIFKRKVARAGLQGEIEELTEEITAYPNNPLSYNNRGVARHRQGDYLGAIKDFSRAIELDPSSALGFNNRGLSRLKIEDLAGALGDFTKAAELKPSDATIFFNRGIALVRSAEYARAIKDFERAGLLDPKMRAKSQEQVEYCRSRLKSG